MNDVAKLTALIEPSCVASGFELYDIEVSPGRLRVMVERSGASFDLDEVAVLSRAISDVLDIEDASEPKGLLAAPYELEVTSPGLERPLRRHAHYVGAVGSVIAVRTKAGAPGERRVQGRLVEAGADVFVVIAEQSTEKARGLAKKPLQGKGSRHTPLEANSGVGLENEHFSEASEARWTISYRDVQRANVVFDWRAAFADSHDGQAETSSTQPATDVVGETDEISHEVLAVAMEREPSI